MDHLLAGFANELVKLSTARGEQSDSDEELRELYKEVKKKSQGGGDGGLDKIRGHGRRVSRDYLASSLIGATATPAAVLLGKKISRGMHNRDVIRAMKGLKGARRKSLEQYIEKGPVFSKGGPPFSKQAPMMTHGELAGHAARGGVMGSVIQMLRDRFSGSAGASGE